MANTRAPGSISAAWPEYDLSSKRQHQMEMHEAPARELEQLFDKVETYGKTTFELAKLKSLEVTTIVVTSLVSKLAVVIDILPVN
jgi:hypothetical protein